MSECEFGRMKNEEKSVMFFSQRNPLMDIKIVYKMSSLVQGK
jgi:hypothetical protein